MTSLPRLSLSPTDISQFIRLDQCERYLKLRLQMRSGDTKFLREAGVVPQSIPPLLTRSGAEFEAQIEARLTQHFKVHNCAELTRQDSDNTRILQLAQNLAPGEIVIVMQPRLSVQIGEWQLRGDLDILRLERDANGVLHALIVDMKSSTSAKNEHRLQVAFYHRMVESLFKEAEPTLQIQTGVIYRGDESEDFTDEEKAKLADQRAQAARFFGSDEWPLEIVADGQAFLDVVESLVTGPDSRAAQIAAQEQFESLKAHLTYKCDGCLFTNFA